ncbi:hypothetical protein N7466_002992 [Penicillium verhagenii]|uniref:uncharacterized protein n=1 Tax=Penicillium verhagenii TaxID=1562060 RepID=UPI0025454D9B|nr:uncharacterized protein N7466_002992 [Penicillium verhagenii]KAJ5936542.1 hypothetical protein N7466_002992 [Penicillium verhagenii]
MQGNDLSDAPPDNKEVETSPLSCVPCGTAPVFAPEEATGALSDLSVASNSQQESAKRKLSITGPFHSPHPGDPEDKTEPTQTSDPSEDRCSSADNAPGHSRDSSIAEDHPTPSGPFVSPNIRSASKFAHVRTSLRSEIPVRHPSIAVVVPPPSWNPLLPEQAPEPLRQYAKGDSAQVEAPAITKMMSPLYSRLKEERNEELQSDHFAILRTHPHPLHLNGVRGSALLTIESNSGPNPAYFFTFVPEPSPMISLAHTAATPGKQVPYTSDENALLVRLKEREAMPWSQIASHFPGRNISSLQVHYSTNYVTSPVFGLVGRRDANK